MYSGVLLLALLVTSANLFSFQAISLPNGSGDRGTVFPFGLSANEDGGPNKQSSLACLRNTNR